MKIVVLDGYALNPGDLSWDGLRALGDAAIHDRSPEDGVLERSRDADALLVNKISLGSDRQERLPNLRYIGVLATGYNIVDIAAARERGITVTNIPTYGTASVAQHTIALLLDLTNRVGEHSAAVQAGEWSRSPDWSYSRKPLVELAGRTFGIIGFGRIGQATGQIAHALGMRVIAYDDNMSGPPPDYPFSWISLRGLLEEADAVSLHCPLAEDTRGLINAKTLKRMKPSAYLLNASRGLLVIEQDLADALNAGQIAGAALDVLGDEPPAANNPLLAAKNCTITPHNAWATKEARSRLLDTAVDNLRAWIEGRPQNVVS